MPCGECLRPRVLSRARGSPSPPPKEPSAYWALPTPGSRWRSAGFNKLEDEDFGSGEGPSEHPGAGSPDLSWHLELALSSPAAAF